MRKWLFGLASILLLAGAGLCLGPVNESRERDHLMMPPAPKTVRPSMLLTPMLALGRAPIVDYLWLRATKAKEEGRVFDAYQLSEMICELQPKFAAVWAFAGWNMSYNISVTFKSPEQRWRWVRNGYELIRDKGIPLNPRNMQLYRELAWILFHKVGDFTDELHWYYKLQFALLNEDILGPPPVDYVQRGRTAGDYYRNYDFKPLADAPEKFEDLLKRADVRELSDKLKGFGFDVASYGTYLGLLDSMRAGKVEIAVPEGQKEDKRVALKAVMADPALAEARAALEHFWRALRLRNEMRLDPSRIVLLEKWFGVMLDFRLPETHAMYWGNLGLEKGLEKPGFIDTHRLNTDRIEFFCLQNMFRRGRMEMSKAAKMGEPPILTPDIRMVPILFDAFVRGSKQYIKSEHHKNEVSVNFEGGFIGFLRSAILRYHELGNQAEAKKLFDYLKAHYPDPMYNNGFDGFVALQYKEDTKNDDYKSAVARIEAIIFRGLQCYAYGEDEDAVRYLTRAQQVYDFYQKDTVSARMKIPEGFTFRAIIRKVADERCSGMYRASYEEICRKIGVPALPEGHTTTSAPANGGFEPPPAEGSPPPAGPSS